MITDSVINWIREHCQQVPPDKPLQEDTPLLDQGWLDSLQIMHLVSHLEKEHAVSVDVEEMVPENFETAGRVAALIQRLKSA